MILEQRRETAAYTEKIPMPTMSNHQAKSKVSENAVKPKTARNHASLDDFPFDTRSNKERSFHHTRDCKNESFPSAENLQISRNFQESAQNGGIPQNLPTFKNIIIDGESAGLVYTDKNVPKSLHYFSGVGLISALESIKVHPKLKHLQSSTFPFLPGVRMFPHIAYPHAHDMDQLWPYMNRSLKVKQYPVNGDRIFYTPFRQIGLTNELIETDYRKTILNLAARFEDGCLVVSNHVEEIELEGRDGVVLKRFEFDRSGRLVVLDF